MTQSNFELTQGPWKVHMIDPTELENALNEIEIEGEYQITQMVPPMGDNSAWTILTRRMPVMQEQETGIPAEVAAALARMKETSGTPSS